MRLARSVIGTAVLASVIPIAGFGQEQARCLPYADARKELAETHGEAPIWHGVSRSGHLLEIWASLDRQTWTVLAISPAGRACAMDDGAGWEHVAAAPVGTPA